MLVLVLQGLASMALYPHWPVKTSKSIVERKGSWPMCAIRQKDSRDGRDTSPRSAHNNVTEWSNESMEKTHNPYYKGFGMSFYDTYDWRTIMHSLIPSTSQQSAFWRLNLSSYNLCSPQIKTRTCQVPVSCSNLRTRSPHYVAGKFAHV